MKYQLIDRSKAPDPRNPTSKAARQFEELVDALAPGKVARVEPQGTETVRGVKAAITRAAKRRGRPVRSWGADGKVYAELAAGPRDAPADPARDPMAELPNV